MNRDEKIARLKNMGIYEKWENNIIAAGRARNAIEGLLNHECSWNNFIACSFKWKQTLEGFDFWEEVSNKEV